MQQSSQDVSTIQRDPSAYDNFAQLHQLENFNSSLGQVPAYNDSFFDQTNRPVTRQIPTHGRQRQQNMNVDVRRPITQIGQSRPTAKNTIPEPDAPATSFDARKSELHPERSVGSVDSSCGSFNTAVGTINGYQGRNQKFIMPSMPQLGSNQKIQYNHMVSQQIGDAHQIQGFRTRSEQSIIPVKPSKKQSQKLEALIGGDDGNNAFYQKIIMDELNLQNQQLQKEFDIINSRKKMKKNKNQAPEIFNEKMPYVNQANAQLSIQEDYAQVPLNHPGL